MKIILVRHGQTDWNKNDLMQGQVDIPLNENGINQAIEIAKMLKDIKIDYIYSSTLERAITTAKYINKDRNLPINLDKRLVERGFGNLEGKKGSAKDLIKYDNLKLNVSEHSIEPIRDVFSRCHSFLSDIYQKYENTDATILLVTHGGVNLAMSSILLGVKENILEYALKNCQYKTFENIKLKKLEEIYGEN